MGINPTQVALQHKGRRYSGIFSVAGNLMIARIPGIDSRSANVDGADPTSLARQICEQILADAEKDGRIPA